MSPQFVTVRTPSHPNPTVHGEGAAASPTAWKRLGGQPSNSRSAAFTSPTRRGRPGGEASCAALRLPPIPEISIGRESSRTGPEAWIAGSVLELLLAGMPTTLHDWPGNPYVPG